MALLLRQSFFGNLFESSGTYHLHTTGCMNDFVGNKEEVKFKMQSGMICKCCLDKMQESLGGDMLKKQLLKSAYQVLQKVKADMTFFQHPIWEDESVGYEVYIDELYNIFILVDGNEVKLNIRNGWKKALLITMLQKGSLDLKKIAEDRQYQKEYIDCYIEITGKYRDKSYLIRRISEPGFKRNFIYPELNKLQRDLEKSLQEYPSLIREFSILKPDSSIRKLAIPLDKIKLPKELRISA